MKIKNLCFIFIFIKLIAILDCIIIDEKVLKNNNNFDKNYDEENIENSPFSIFYNFSKIYNNFNNYYSGFQFLINTFYYFGFTDFKAKASMKSIEESDRILEQMKIRLLQNIDENFTYTEDDGNKLNNEFDNE